MNLVPYEKIANDNKKLVELNRSLQVAGDELNTANKTLKELNKMIILDNKSFKQKLDKINELENDNFNLKVERSDLKKSELNFLSDINQLKADKQSLDATVKSLKKKNMNQRAEIEKLKTFDPGEKTKLLEEIKKIKSLKAASDACLENLKEKVEALTTEVSSLKSEKINLEEENKGLKSCKEIAEIKYSKLEADKNKMEFRLKAAGGELCKEVERLGSRNSRLSTVLKQLKSGKQIEFIDLTFDDEDNKSEEVCENASDKNQTSFNESQKEKTQKFIQTVALPKESRNTPSASRTGKMTKEIDNGLNKKSKQIEGQTSSKTPDQVESGTEAIEPEMVQKNIRESIPLNDCHDEYQKTEKVISQAKNADHNETRRVTRSKGNLKSSKVTAGIKVVSNRTEEFTADVSKTAEKTGPQTHSSKNQAGPDEIDAPPQQQGSSVNTYSKVCKSKALLGGQKVLHVGDGEKTTSPSGKQDQRMECFLAGTPKVTRTCLKRTFRSPNKSSSPMTSTPKTSLKTSRARKHIFSSTEMKSKKMRKLTDLKDLVKNVSSSGNQTKKGPIGNDGLESKKICLRRSSRKKQKIKIFDNFSEESSDDCDVTDPHWSVENNLEKMVNNYEPNSSTKPGITKCENDYDGSKQSKRSLPTQTSKVQMGGASANKTELKRKNEQPENSTRNSKMLKGNSPKNTTLPKTC